jgi:hypothetical protein
VNRYISTLILALVTLLISTPARAELIVNEGTADINGSASEWNPPSDFVASLYRAGRAHKPVEGKVYLRYDSNTCILYAYALSDYGTNVLADQPNDAFIKLGNNVKLVDGTYGDNNSAPDFQWIGLSGNRANGFEASVVLNPGTYDLNIHMQVYNGGSQTAAFIGRSLTVTLVKNVIIPPGVPEPATLGLGGLSVLGALFATRRRARA